jgi:hypothetical protein
MQPVTSCVSNLSQVVCNVDNTKERKILTEPEMLDSMRCRGQALDFFFVQLKNIFFIDSKKTSEKKNRKQHHNTSSCNGVRTTQ